MEQTAAMAQSTAVEQTTALGQYGPIGLIAAIFATVIVILFKHLREETAARIADQKALAEERAKTALDQEKLRTEYERKHRELVENYAKAIREERDRNREHEDRVRDEFAELMEKVSAESGKASEALATMLQKFLDKVVPSGGSGGRGGRY